MCCIALHQINSVWLQCCNWLHHVFKALDLQSQNCCIKSIPVNLLDVMYCIALHPLNSQQFYGVCNFFAPMAIHLVEYFWWEPVDHLQGSLGPSGPETPKKSEKRLPRESGKSLEKSFLDLFRSFGFVGLHPLPRLFADSRGVPASGDFFSDFSKFQARRAPTQLVGVGVN